MNASKQDNSTHEIWSKLGLEFVPIRCLPSPQRFSRSNISTLFHFELYRKVQSLHKNGGRLANKWKTLPARSSIAITSGNRGFAWVNHFCGGLWTKSMPFAMLPLSPVLQGSRSFFSSSLTSPRMLMAFSAPLGYTSSACHVLQNSVTLRLRQAQWEPRNNPLRSLWQSHHRQSRRANRRKKVRSHLSHPWRL